MVDSFDKFTERARRVLALAQDEAQRFNHNYIGTEHLLLGLTREADGIAGRVLSHLGVSLPRVRSTIESIIGRGATMVVGEIGLTPRAKRVIELAVDEARRLNHRYIGTEHLLLGLVREGEGIAAGVLASQGLRLDQVRATIIETLVAGGMGVSAPPPPAQARPHPGRRLSDEEAALLRERLGDLVQVVPIIEQQTHDTTAILAIALERYDNGFVVTWRLEASGGQRVHPDFVFTAEDDRGNPYRSLMLGGSGGGSAERADWRFAYRFAPALDPAARSLTLDFSPHTGSETADIVAGPWRFTLTIPPLPGA